VEQLEQRLERLLGMTSPNLDPAIIPAGLVIDRHEIGPEGMIVDAHGGAFASVCPTCGTASSSVHSHYSRRLLDLPAHGRCLTIRLSARRFRCRTSNCDRKVFTERFGDGAVASHARRSTRLELLIHAVAVSLGGRPGERLALRLSTPVSADTLVRILRRRAAPTPDTVRVVGIDDFAWRQGQRYGTIVCDLEKRRVIDLLPDREGGTIAAWLRERPGIEVVCRDRGGGSREGATAGAPQALQIADRWHLLENATTAFLDIVRRHMGAIRRAVAHGDIDPTTLSAAQRQQWAGWKHREKANRTVQDQHRRGLSLKAIVRTTGLSRQTVRRILRGTRDDVFRSRESSLDPWIERLETEWNTGCHNGAELWRRLRNAGFGGGLRVVTEWATRKRRSVACPPPVALAPSAVPSSRVLVRLLTSERDCRSTEALRIRVAVESAAPTLVTARNLLDRFGAMVASGKLDDLAPWLAAATGSEMGSFASGIAADRAAVSAAISEPWSNGQTEGQVTKLKLVKRQMYGRGKVDLLRARLVQAA
jgi:transposase